MTAVIHMKEIDLSGEVRGGRVIEWIREGDETGEEERLENTGGGSGPDVRMSDDECVCGGRMGAVWE